MMTEELFRLKYLWSDGDREQLKCRKGNCPTGNSSTVHDTWTGVGSTQYRRTLRSEANRISHCYGRLRTKNIMNLKILFVQYSKHTSTQLQEKQFTYNVI